MWEQCEIDKSWLIFKKEGKKGVDKKLWMWDECEIDKSLFILKKEGKKGVDEKTVDVGQM